LFNFSLPNPDESEIKNKLITIEPKK
jgi:hypothetical protein